MEGEGVGCNRCTKDAGATEKRSGSIEIVRPLERRNIGRTIDMISFALFLRRCKLHKQTVNELHELFAFRRREDVLQAAFHR
jgi:hypothetical protein